LWNNEKSFDIPKKNCYILTMNKRKRTTIIVSCASVLALAVTVVSMALVFRPPADAQRTILNLPDDYYWAVNQGGTITITGLVGHSTDGNFILEIPSIINGIVVTEIGEGAFTGALVYGMWLPLRVVQVIIPDTITTIRTAAFVSLNYITSVSIPRSVIYVDTHAFIDCPNLIIHLEQEEFEGIPSTWHSDWNPDARPIIWESKGPELYGFVGVILVEHDGTEQTRRFPSGWYYIASPHDSLPTHSNHIPAPQAPPQHTFLGWSLVENGHVNWRVGGAILITHNIRLYAVFRIID
jgi:hypothetical protein